jgi:hypothetical protein
VPFAGPNGWQTPLGLRRLHDIPGLADALREGKTFFVIPQDESNPVLRREFSARFPDSGYRIARTWLRVPVANVHKFVDKVAEYSRALAAAADKRASWM